MAWPWYGLSWTQKIRAKWAYLSIILKVKTQLVKVTGRTYTKNCSTLRKTVTIKTCGTKQTFSLKRHRYQYKINRILVPPSYPSNKPCLFISQEDMYSSILLLSEILLIFVMCLTPQPAVSRNQDRTEQVVPSASLLLLKISYCDMPHVILFFLPSLKLAYVQN